MGVPDRAAVVLRVLSVRSNVRLDDDRIVEFSSYPPGGGHRAYHVPPIAPKDANGVRLRESLMKWLKGRVDGGPAVAEEFTRLKIIEGGKHYLLLRYEVGAAPYEWGGPAEIAEPVEQQGDATLHSSEVASDAECETPGDIRQSLEEHSNIEREVIDLDLEHVSHSGNARVFRFRVEMPHHESVEVPNMLRIELAGGGSVLASVSPAIDPTGLYARPDGRWRMPAQAWSVPLQQGTFVNVAGTDAHASEEDIKSAAVTALRKLTCERFPSSNLSNLILEMERKRRR